MSKDKLARVYHADLWGSREEKYAWLSEHDWKHTPWEELHPGPEFYLFVPTGKTALEEQYNTFPKVTEIFPVYSVGIVTARDNFVVCFDKEALKRRIRTFLDPNLPDNLVRQTFGLKDSKAWNLEVARKILRNDTDWQRKIVRCLYRPFDVRWLFYHPALVERPREEVMRHMVAGENLGLLWTRPMSPTYEFSVLCSQYVADQCVVGNKTAGAGISYIGPLYLFPDVSRKDLFIDHEPTEKKPNLNDKVVAVLASVYKQTPTPQEVFSYIYAVLYTPTYRENYAEFLRIDFPRIPFTSCLLYTSPSPRD